MQVPGRKFALLTGPLVVAAAMLAVPLAGPAQALSKTGPDCSAIMEQVEYYWNESKLDTYDAQVANDHGDWFMAAYYDARADYNEGKGNELYSSLASRGC